MKLIYDITSTADNKPILLEGKTIQDGAGKPKTIKLIGPQIICNVVNTNRRIYPTNVMDEAVEKYVNTWVKTNRGYGELEHPERLTIDPSLACDRLISLTRDPHDENVWIGESIVMASDPAHGIHGTPKGDILAGILCHGGSVGRSTRGAGDYDKSTGVVQPGYTLFCLDTVIDPSATGCMSKYIVEGVLVNKEFMINEHGVPVEIAYNALDAKLSNLPKHEKNAFVDEAIRQFLKTI